MYAGNIQTHLIAESGVLLRHCLHRKQRFWQLRILTYQLFRIPSDILDIDRLNPVEHEALANADFLESVPALPIDQLTPGV